MTLLDDFVVAGGATVITSASIVLGLFLIRYRQMVAESTKSTELAKSVYDSMNSRLAVMDARIIDLMVKVDVYSTKQGVNSIEVPLKSMGPPQEIVSQNPEPRIQREYTNRLLGGVGNPDTERQILTLLVGGSRTSNQINLVVGKSREHMGRLMKGLFERGLVVRNDRNKPYVYEITEAGRRYLTGS